MTKVAQDSYLQGAVDFLKTASVDPAIGEATLDFITKSAGRNPGPSAREQRAQRSRSRKATRTEGRRAARKSKARRARSIPTSASAAPTQAARQSNPLRGMSASELLARQPNLPASLPATSAGALVPTQAARQLGPPRAAPAAELLARELRPLPSAAGGPLVPFLEQISAGPTPTESVRIPREQAPPSLRRTARELVGDLAKSQSAARRQAEAIAQQRLRAEAAEAATNELRRTALRQMNELRGKNQDISRARDALQAELTGTQSTLSSTQAARDAAQRSLQETQAARDAAQKSLQETRGTLTSTQKALGRAKMHRLGLGGLAALGLGYAGYDQLSGGGLGREPTLLERIGVM